MRYQEVTTKIQEEYNQDFYAWTIHNAQLLREGKLSEIDIEHIAEEIESMGNGDKRELVSHLAVLIAHLLKWQYQPMRQSKSWMLTIKEQRIKIIQLLKESPSLKHEINSKLEDAYEQAVVKAEIETALDESTFPHDCPFNLDQCLDQRFFPE